MSNPIPAGAANLLDALIAKIGLKNDAALSRVLEVGPPVISKLRYGHLQVGANILIRMHEESGMSIRELKAYLVDTNVAAIPHRQSIDPLNSSINISSLR